MKQTVQSCSKCGHNDSAVKNGRTNQGKQRYKCKQCGSRFLNNYTYKSYLPSVNANITGLKKEGMGIRSISRYLGISHTTVIDRIKAIASRTKKPVLHSGRVYELDEMCTWIGDKESRYWLAYAIDRKTKTVVDFKVGKRTNKTLRHVVDTLVLSNPKKIFTDRLKNYKYLIPKELHSTKLRGTNGIEANNL